MAASWHAGTSYDPPSVATHPHPPLSAAGIVQSPLQDAISPTLQQHPSSSRHGSSTDDLNGRKRKRSSADGLGEDGGEGSVMESPSMGKHGRHQPGVKRACNDCRQQKVASLVLKLGVESSLTFFATASL